AKLFPTTKREILERNLPLVVNALSAENLTSSDMALMALATIRVEVGDFIPISEGQSRWNTSGKKGGHPFDRYDERNDLGNQGSPDGATFKGRGFVQLTGRANYTKYSAALGLGTALVDDPEQANDPDIAAKLLARFLKDKETGIGSALAARDYRT